MDRSKLTISTIVFNNLNSCSSDDGSSSREKVVLSKNLNKTLYECNSSSVVYEREFPSKGRVGKNKYYIYRGLVEKISTSELNLWDFKYKSYIECRSDLFDFKSTVDRKSFEFIARELKVEGLFKKRVFDFYEEAQEEGEELLLKSRSLLSLLRFYPMLTAYSDYELDFYLDSTGVLGAAYRHMNITLNLLFKENDEVVFSSYDSEEAMVRIVGSSMFSALLPNSRKIKRILRLLED